ncbi:hypothetical protein JCM8097_004356 [Rhodosporidiobolus ruineniae]
MPATGSTSTARDNNSPAHPRLDALLLPPTPPMSPSPLHSSSPTSLSSLPPEILSTIFTHLPASSLASCALTALFLLPLARAQLYRTLSFRNQRHGKAAPSGSSALDERSTALLETLTAHPSLARLAARLDFDLLSHLSFGEITALLGEFFALCPSLSALRLGAGAHGHGIGFRPLRDALSLGLGLELSGASSSPASTLRVLDVEHCNGAPHTLAAVLVQLPALEELRVGQFLLEKGDFAPSVLPSCRLRTLVAQRGRLTSTALSFLSAASGSSLRAASLPVCEQGAPFDLTPFRSLTRLTLFVFLSSPPPGLSPSHPSFEATMSRLARNFSSTVASLPYLSHLTLLGAWDAPSCPSPHFLTSSSSSSSSPPSSSSVLPTVSAASLGAGLAGGLAAHQPVDLVLHARLLHFLPAATLRALSVRTELNALALGEWLADGGWWAANPSSLSRLREGAGEGQGEGFRLEVWQKTSYSGPRREFQRRVREKVELAAQARRGVSVEWRTYEQW